MRSFNTAGPVNPTDHYLIAPLSRIDLDEVLGLVRDKKYFVLHAPRQTGKTSALLALAEVLNERGYGCVYATVETARTARDDVQRAMRVVLATLANAASAALGDRFLRDVWAETLAEFGPDLALSVALERWASASPRPLVLLIDEIDTLVGDSLLSVLQQIRAGYPGRPARFPHSVVLCGMRDLRDYRMGVGRQPVQHRRKVAAAGRLPARGDDGAAGPAHRRDRPGVRPGGAGGGVDADARPALAGERAGVRCLLRKQDGARRPFAHGDRGRHRRGARGPDREPGDAPGLSRRQAAGGPRAAGDRADAERHAPARLHGPRCRVRARDLGLVACDAPLRVANPIYAEVLPRELAWVAQETLDLSPPRYVRTDGSLDAELLMEEFQTFFRRHSEHWQNRFAYAEAWPQLLLQAYLQRVVNGGGRIEREYALGRGRVDLLIVWPLQDRVQELVVECKVVRERDGLESVVDEGVEQTARYVDRCAAEAGHLIVIDRRENRELGGESIPLPPPLGVPASRRHGAGRRVGHVTGLDAIQAAGHGPETRRILRALADAGAVIPRDPPLSDERAYWSAAAGGGR